MSEHSAEGGELALALWLEDWPGEPDQGRRIWHSLGADLLPKRLYLAKSDRLMAQGWGRVIPRGSSDQ